MADLEHGVDGRVTLPPSGVMVAASSWRRLKRSLSTSSSLSRRLQKESHEESCFPCKSMSQKWKSLRRRWPRSFRLVRAVTVVGGYFAWAYGFYSRHLGWRGLDAFYYAMATMSTVGSGAELAGGSIFDSSAVASS